MKRDLLIILVVFLIFTDQYVVVDGVYDYDSDVWQQASEFLRESINSEVKPCENFFDHVCGNYNWSSGNTYQTYLSKASLMTADKILEALDSIDRSVQNVPRYRKAAGEYFRNCVETAGNIDSDWLIKAYRTISTRLGPLVTDQRSLIDDPPDFDLSYFLGRINAVLDNPIFVQPAMEYRQGEVCSKTTPDTMYLELLLHPNASSINLTDVSDMLQTLTSDPSKASEIDDLLANVTRLYEELKRPLSNTSYYLYITPHQVAKESPLFNYSRFMDGLVGEEARRVLFSRQDGQVVAHWKAFNDKFEMLKLHRVVTLRTFAYVKALQWIRNKYSNDVRLESDYTVFSAFPPTSRHRCLQYTIVHLPAAMARTYFDHLRIDYKIWRADVLLMIRNIVTAFRVMLNSVDWLNSDDKEKIQQKVDHFAIVPGLPSWIDNDTVISELLYEHDVKESVYENDFRAMAKMQHYEMQRFVEKPEKYEPNPSFRLNAHYESATNTITMCLGLMLPPVFNINYPLPIKYGGLGSIIGHELMHAFDSFSIHRGLPGKEWIRPEALTEFTRNSQCLIRQFSRQCYKDAGKCVRGDRTIGENIADIGGLKVAYIAYKIVAQVLDDDPPLPDMLQYSNDQIFFIASARLQCAKGTPSDGYLALVHSPHKVRVEMKVRNVPQFASAFRCTSGSKYAPSKRCNVWGDLFHECIASEENRYERRKRRSTGR